MTSGDPRPGTPPWRTGYLPGSLPRASLTYPDWEPRDGSATVAEPGVVF